MSNDDVENLLKLMPRPQHNLWRVAFDEYNNDHKDDRPLSLNCMPCYIKVRKYIMEKYAQPK